MSLNISKILFRLRNRGLTEPFTASINSNLKHDNFTNNTIDFEKSAGNFFHLLNGSKIANLDSSAMPLGLNNEFATDAYDSTYFKNFLMSSKKSNRFTSMELDDDIHDFLERIYPYGRKLTDVELTSSYRETLWKVVYNVFNRDSSIVSHPKTNQILGNFLSKSNYQIATFNTNPVSFFPSQWATLQTPDLSYPTRKYKRVNELEEINKLEKIEEILKENRDIRGILVPGEFGEGRFVTPFFYKGLREVCTRLDIAFILDESTSALMQGEVWAHRQWGAWVKDYPMDFLLFGQSMLCNGFLMQPQWRPSNSANPTFYNNKQTILDLKRCRLQLDVIMDMYLLMRSMDTMAYFRTESDRVQREYPDVFESSRGIGNTLVTQVGNDSLNKEQNQLMRDQLADNLLSRHGVYVQKTGNAGILVKPSLMAEPTFMSIYFDALRLEAAEYYGSAQTSLHKYAI